MALPLWLNFSVSVDVCCLMDTLLCNFVAGKHSTKHSGLTFELKLLKNQMASVSTEHSAERAETKVEKLHICMKLFPFFQYTLANICGVV